MKKNTFNTVVPTPLWRKVTAFINIFMLMFYTCLPGTVAAYEIITDSFISTNVSDSSQFQLSNNSQYSYEKVHYIEDSVSVSSQNIATFHQKLLDFRKTALPAPVMVPIMNGDITIILPIYELGQQVGDPFVQARLIRSQIFNLLNRNLLSDAYGNEAAQINDLYNKAFDFAATSTRKFGDKLNQQEVNTFNNNFVWPERRTINGKQVLVPIVHLTTTTVDNLRVDGHVIEFGGDTVALNNLVINAGTVHTRKSTFLNVANNLSINEGAALRSNKDLNVRVGGTLQLLSGQIHAAENVNIIAGQYTQKTIYHRFGTPTTQGSRLGEVANVSGNNITIRSANDITIVGGNVSGNNVTFEANGNIAISSQETSYVRNVERPGFSVNESTLSQLQSQITAQDSIRLIANGAIEISGSTIHANSGVIEVLAGQGIYILNTAEQFQSARHSEYDNTTTQTQEFQSVAIRSALKAGQNIVIATELGDITLKATELTSTTGTQINARNGAVNFLLTKEQDNYFYNRVSEGFLKIKTTTIQDDVETAVYNEIIGGVKVQATQGLTIELGQYADGGISAGIDTETARISAELKALNESLAEAKELGLATDTITAQIQLKSEELLQEQLSQLAGNNSSLAWMQEVYNDPDYQDSFKLVYQELVELHKFDRTSSLSPAAMAIIAIAVAVAMGPGALGWIGTGANAIGPVLGQFIGQAAVQAGALAIATQAATGLASGQGIEDTAKSLFHSDNIKSTATAMVTAGVLDKYKDSFQYFDNVPSENFDTLTSTQQLQSITNQATQAIGHSVVRSGISTVIAGGDLGGFESTFYTSLAQAGVDALGEYMAGEIGDAVHSEAGLNNALRYIAHAGVGCIIGAASGSVNDSEESESFNCASGASGAVVGELIADIAVGDELATLEDKTEKLESDLKTMLFGENSDITDLNNLTSDQETALHNHIKLIEKDLSSYKKQFSDLKAEGIDIAKLGAGLAALAAGADVNLAANAAENAVENNAVWFVAYGAVLLWKAYELYEMVDGVVQTYKKLDDATEEEQEKILEDLVVQLGWDLLLNVTGGKLIDRVIDYAKNTKVGDELIIQLNKLKDKLDNPDKQVTYEGGAASVGGNLPNSNSSTGTNVKGSGIKFLPISETKIQDILAKPKGERPEAKDYLSKGYYDAHLDEFSEGAVFIGPKPNPLWPETSPHAEKFIMPKREADELLNRTGGDIALLEKELGIPQGSWQEQAADYGGMLRVEIPPNILKEKNIRMPSGNEGGADANLWRPGGFTYSPEQTEPVREAIIDTLAWSEIAENLISDF
jgi:hypothetical protein